MRCYLIQWLLDVVFVAVFSWLILTVVQVRNILRSYANQCLMCLLLSITVLICKYVHTHTHTQTKYLSYCVIPYTTDKGSSCISYESLLFGRLALICLMRSTFPASAKQVDPTQFRWSHNQFRLFLYGFKKKRREFR